LQLTFEHNLAELRASIAAAARAVGRDPAEITLLAVTKAVPAAFCAAWARLGLVDLGENRAEDLHAKALELARLGLEPRWHFVGHLQRNKARDVVRDAHVIHSIDSMRLLETVARIAEDERRIPRIYVQVKLSTEATKSGLDPRDLAAVLARAAALGSVRLEGLMTMAPLLADELAQRAAAETVFRELARLAELHAHAFTEAPRLSMGMSDDFEAAIRAGSHVVRIGSRLHAGLTVSAAASAARPNPRDPAP
jgi:pyridoxal phosphate enzyme (YggS family)